MKSNLLFCRVIQLIFVGPGETFLNPRVHPQPFKIFLINKILSYLYYKIHPQPLHPRQQLLRERLCVLHPAHHVHHHLRVPLPLVVAEVDVQVGHGPEDGHQGLQRGKLSSMRLDLSKRMNVQTGWRGNTPKWQICHSHKTGFRKC